MTYSEQMAIAVARKVHKRWCVERTPCEYGHDDMRVARDILDGLVAEGFATPDGGWEATNGQLRYVDGYREAISRLRDDERYTRAPEHLRRWNADVRHGLADYLEQHYAPDPIDPWADAVEQRVSAESRSDDTSKITEGDAG